MARYYTTKARVKCACPDGRSGNIERIRAVIHDDGSVTAARHGVGSDCGDALGPRDGLPSWFEKPAGERGSGEVYARALVSCFEGDSAPEGFEPACHWCGLPSIEAQRWPNDVGDWPRCPHCGGN